MANPQKPAPPRPSPWRGPATVFGVMVLMFAVTGAALWLRYEHLRAKASATSVSPQPKVTNAPAPAVQAAPAPATLPVNQAVMVTVELDFGGPPPSIADALQHIERRHQPEDQTSRTFAILDAYGGPTADGKKLHLSMHVSSEKPGVGALLFRRTGEVLWQSRIVPATNAAPFTGKNLTIFIDDGAGRARLIDGSHNPASILDARLHEGGMAVRDFWPDNAEREVTFIYSACGCPVKAKVRRAGERTTRTTGMPVMFPDDPAVMQVIARLMGW